MYLSDTFIKRFGPRLIEPFNPDLINPSSYDITLQDTALLRGEELVHLPFILNPGEFILVSSEQYWKFPCDVSGQLLLKSSLGRCAINHMLAGWFDPDFHGNATMELKNEGHKPFELVPGAKVAQMVFHAGPPVERPYRFKGRYHGQRGVTGVRNEVSKSTTLDVAPLWVTGSIPGIPVDDYLKWYDHVKLLLDGHPEYGTLDKLSVS